MNARLFLAFAFALPGLAAPGRLLTVASRPRRCSIRVGHHRPGRPRCTLHLRLSPIRKAIR